MTHESTTPQVSDPATGRGFHFTDRMRLLCIDITTRCPEMQHIDMTHVAVSFNQTRKAVRHGMWASLTPMRFENGSRTTDATGSTLHGPKVA